MRSWGFWNLLGTVIKHGENRPTPPFLLQHKKQGGYPYY